MILGRGYASCVVREGFLEEVALVLNQRRRERRHMLGRERWMQGPKAGAFLACSDLEGDRG